MKGECTFKTNAATLAAPANLSGVSTMSTASTIQENVTEFALDFMGFRHLAGTCYVRETSNDGASYLTITSLDAFFRRNEMMDTPVRVVTVIDGESLGGDDFHTLRDALIDLYGASEGETIPAMLS
jgi:hypothetical protein